LASCLSISHASPFTRDSPRVAVIEKFQFLAGVHTPHATAWSIRALNKRSCTTCTSGDVQVSPLESTLPGGQFEEQDELCPANTIHVEHASIGHAERPSRQIVKRAPHLDNPQKKMGSKALILVLAK
jgi:hypothetical protein